MAAKLGVSNKTISKWETGKSMPELIDGEEAEEKSVRTYDNDQIIDLLRRTQELEK